MINQTTPATKNNPVLFVIVLIIIFVGARYYLPCLSAQEGTTKQPPHPTQSQESPRTSELIVLKHSRAKDITKPLEMLLPAIKVYPDEIRNAVQVYNTPQLIEEAKAIIQSNDVPYKQAIITLQIAEISRSKSKTIGIELTNYSWNLPTLLPPRVGRLTEEQVVDLFPGIVQLKGEKADVNIKANPKVLVVGNQRATFGAGDRVPIPITQTQVISGQIAQTTSIQFEEVGVKLQVTPHIFEKENELLLEITGEVSSIGRTTPQGYPQIATRNIDSAIRIKSDWTAVIGGLLKEEDRKVRIGIPFLMDVPLLGYVFSSTKLEKVITEVQIYITPQIVSSQQFNPPVVPDKR